MHSDDLAPRADGHRPAGIGRHVAVTPPDLRQARFSTAMRGFDRAEVQALLLEAADDFDAALRENERLRQEVARLTAALDQYRELETSLRGTLVGAQRVADDMREHAAQDADRIVVAAENQAAAIVERAHGQLEDLQREIDGMRLKRRDAEAAIEATIATLQRTLEDVRGGRQ